MWGKHFSVKGDLKASFIDGAADLFHIRDRRVAGCRVQESNFQDGDDGPASGDCFDTPAKENLMIRENTFKDVLTRGRHAACAFGLLIFIAALPAYGQQQVHQLLYDNNNWTDQNLNGSQSISNGPIAAFVTTPNDQPHVYFLATNGDVHQHFYNGASWSDDDLTVLSGGAAASGQLSGFSVGNYQYVYYVSLKAPQHVHQLLYNNIGWVDSDLTVLSKSKVQAINYYGLVAFTTSPALHVNYQQYPTGDIHQLYSTDGKTWQDQDLTTLTGAPQPYILWSGFNIGNLQYVYYQDKVSLDLHQLNYNNANWSDTDLTVSSKIARPSLSVGDAFVIPGTKKMRIYYVNDDNDHLMQLASANGKNWASTDLTKRSKAPKPDGGTSILAYATTPNDGVHVFYESGQHINEIFQPTTTTWANDDLTAAGYGGPAVDFTHIAGFSLENYQYVFYVAQ